MSNIVTIKNFEHLSVEARYAYTLCCLKKALEYFNLQDPDWHLVLDALWGFFDCEPMDDITPRLYLFEDLYMNRPSMPYYRVYTKVSPEPDLDLDTFNRIAKLYYFSNDTIIFLFYEAYYSFIHEELYSNRFDNSPGTLNNLQLFFDTMEKHQIPHPIVDWQILNEHTTKDSFHYAGEEKDKKSSKFLKQIRQTFK